MENYISSEQINNFLQGSDPMERIVNMEYNYNDSYIKIIYRDENNNRKEMMDPFHPFVWATRHACVKLCGGNRKEVKRLMTQYGIGIKVLNTNSIDGTVCPNIENGYIFMFYAINAMSYTKFLNFFKDAKNPIYAKEDKIPQSEKDKRQYLIVTPQEQHMISTGKRYFKGYEDYDNLHRMTFDLETSGLNPKVNRIEQIGIRTNKGFERIFTISGNTKEEKDLNEIATIETMFKVIYTLRPDVITAHNGENFDWDFIINRCIELNYPIDKLSAKYFNGEKIYKKNRQSVLKLGGEVEYFYQTIIPGINTTDSLHAVRRAQALDSNMQKADLKYVANYSNIKKENRVYVKGDKISSTWNDNTKSYAFNNIDGNWYKIDDKHPLKDGYEIVTGKYIVERYLLDDLWECDKVELRYNQTNFLICKLLPTTFMKCCTMGTAGQWKLLMLAWSYENNLAIPPFGVAKKFTGGLSRLLKTGYVSNVVKLDYNSLYPSIILTWKITSPEDLQKVLLAFLEHILTEREKFKGLMKQAGKNKDKAEEKLKETKANNPDDIDEIRLAEVDLNKWAEAESANDKKQLPFKIFGNSYFGSTGNPSLFPFSNLIAAEKTTCIGRMALRLMISHFTKLGYEPIVGDSFTGDTPLFIKYKDNNFIDIKPVEDMINEDEIKVDVLGREYDYSEKPYWVLCRSGWVDAEYVYRHETNKPIYKVEDIDKHSMVEVTEDHSLFDSNKNKIKPSEITENTELEYYSDIDNIYNFSVYEVVDNDKLLNISKDIISGKEKYIPTWCYNLNYVQTVIVYKRLLNDLMLSNTKLNKTIIAGVRYLENKLKNNNTNKIL